MSRRGRLGRRGAAGRRRTGPAEIKESSDGRGALTYWMMADMHRRANVPSEGMDRDPRAPVEDCVIQTGEIPLLCKRFKRCIKRGSQRKLATQFEPQSTRVVHRFVQCRSFYGQSLRIKSVIIVLDISLIRIAAPVISDRTTV